MTVLEVESHRAALIEIHEAAVLLPTGSLLVEKGEWAKPSGVLLW